LIFYQATPTSVSEVTLLRRRVGER